jgi:hypothetical protein
MRIAANVALALALGQSAKAAFGFTSTSKGYSVDTDGGLVFEINKYTQFTERILKPRSLTLAGPMVTSPASNTKASNTRAAAMHLASTLVSALR